METLPAIDSSRGERDPLTGHLLIVLAISAGFELLFLHAGVSWLDEGWPLYAAMRLHAGGVLYHDVLWVFPPGHLAVAWLARAIDPPGVLLARALYGLFDVALCISLYFLGRRVMAPRFALLGALLVALSASRSHYLHLLFGYRYLVWSILALLALDQRLRGGAATWIVAAGAFTGIGLVFRLTPAFATGCGVAAALLATHRDWRRTLGDAARFGLGLAAVTAPVLVWLAVRVGLSQVWRELLVHPLEMLQPLEMPELALPGEWTRAKLYGGFVAVLFRALWVLYSGYALALVALWLRARRRGEAFRHGLLTAVVVMGAVFALRTLGRSDDHHLNSALPPFCLLLAHALATLLQRARRRAPGGGRRAAELAWCGGLLLLWAWLGEADLYLDPEVRGRIPLRSLEGRVHVRPQPRLVRMDREVAWIRRHTPPGRLLLDLSASPLLYVVAQRAGPGWLDVVMPGTFTSRRQDLQFVELLERSPPAVVVWPRQPFDGMRERSLERTAPELAAWVRAHYRTARRTRDYLLMLPAPEVRAP